MNDEVHQGRIDSEALVTATLAKQQVSSHEIVCAERYQGIQRQFSAVFRLLWGTAIGVIMTLITTLGAIIMFMLDKMPI